MLTINNKQYASNDKEFTNSLFNAGGTCVGYYKRTARGIQLMNMQKKLFAFVVNNKNNEQFFVSATRMKDTNRVRYSFALSSADDKALGFDKISYSEQSNIAKQLFN